MDKSEILQAVERERIRQGMSKRKLAEKAGFTDRSLYMWESDKRGMTLTNADSLLKAVGLKLVIEKGDESNEQSSQGHTGNRCQGDRPVAVHKQGENDEDV